MHTRPYTLSIAGFDPSGGAGVLADTKTFEQLEVYGLAVATANTIQNDSEFDRLDWVKPAVIIEQIDVLARKWQWDYVKIGLIEGLDVLEQVVGHLTTLRPGVKIIWDPILAASAGFTFHSQVAWQQLKRICDQLFLITPNVDEMQQLYNGNAMDGALALSEYCHVLMTGTETADTITDHLVVNGVPTPLYGRKIDSVGKHGSGCVLSAAITAHLTKGVELETACWMAKRYTSNLIASNSTLLGYHHTAQQAPQKNISALHYITQHMEGVSHVQLAETACKGGAPWVQLRVKNVDNDTYCHIAKQVKAVCHHYGATFIVNDNVEVAWRVQADGVHLGQQDMPLAKARAILGETAIIGGTANTFEQIKTLHQEGADYIGLGPYQFTSTKEKLSPVLGMEGYLQLMAKCNDAGIAIPVIAIGGIAIEDVGSIMRTGVHGIAVASGIAASNNPAAAVQQYIAAINTKSIDLILN